MTTQKQSYRLHAPSRPLIQTILLVAILITASLTVAGSEVFAQISQVKVSARAEVTAEPDTAHFALGVTSKDADASKAMTRNSDKMRQVLRALRSHVPNRQLKTRHVQLMERYEFSGRQRTFSHYEASNSVEVTLYQDLNKLPKMLGEAIAAGANVVGQIAFDVQDRKPYEKQARLQAVADLREKAEQIAQAAGYVLGKPLLIQEGTQPAPFASYSYAVEGVSARSLESAAAPPVEAGVLSISVEIHADYSLLNP